MTGGGGEMTLILKLDLGHGHTSPPPPPPWSFYDQGLQHPPPPGTDRSHTPPSPPGSDQVTETPPPPAYAGGIKTRLQRSGPSNPEDQDARLSYTPLPPEISTKVTTHWTPRRVPGHMHPLPPGSDQVTTAVKALPLDI